MVTLVEDIAGRQIAVVDAAQGCLRHHQRMVGDDDIGAASRPHVCLDKAFAVVAAGCVNALSPAVGKTQGLAPADQVDQPGR